jgi:hypothetical protein
MGRKGSGHTGESAAALPWGQSDDDPILEARKLAFVRALLDGLKPWSAARRAGVAETTGYRWLRTEQVRAALRKESEDRDAVRKTFRDLLDSPQTPPLVRLKAGLALLNQPEAKVGVRSLEIPQGIPREEREAFKRFLRDLREKAGLKQEQDGHEEGEGA